MLVCMVGFNKEECITLLERSDVKKVVIFNGDVQEDRDEYEHLYDIYKDRLTMYEGDIELNLNAYLQQHREERFDMVVGEYFR